MITPTCSLKDTKICHNLEERTVVILRASARVSEAVRMVKANTGRAMRQKFKFLDKVYWGMDGIWSTCILKCYGREPVEIYSRV